MPMTNWVRIQVLLEYYFDLSSRCITSVQKFYMTTVIRMTVCSAICTHAHIWPSGTLYNATTSSAGPCEATLQLPEKVSLRN